MTKDKIPRNEIGGLRIKKIEEFLIMITLKKLEIENIEVNKPPPPQHKHKNQSQVFPEGNSNHIFHHENRYDLRNPRKHEQWPSQGINVTT